MARVGVGAALYPSQYQVFLSRNLYLRFSAIKDLFCFLKNTSLDRFSSFRCSPFSLIKVGSRRFIAWLCSILDFYHQLFS